VLYYHISKRKEKCDDLVSEIIIQTLMNNSFDYDGLITAAEIFPGMTVDLVIDLFNTLNYAKKKGITFDYNEFIDALQARVGEKGNILIRSFTWDWCHGKGFDIRNSSSQVGALGTAVLKRNDFQRTKHPIYNWMVWGNDQEYLCGLDYKESFEETSVFAWEEHNENAYQVNIGEPQSNALTIFHYVEKKTGVPYRYIKDFTDLYIDESGKKNLKTYSMFVRNLSYEIETNADIYNEYLEKEGIRTSSFFDEIRIDMYKLKDLCEVYEKDFVNNKVPSGVRLVPIEQ